VEKAGRERADKSNATRRALTGKELQRPRQEWEVIHTTGKTARKSSQKPAKFIGFIPDLDPEDQ
jgi:hypothetical protein